MDFDVTPLDNRKRPRFALPSNFDSNRAPLTNRKRPRFSIPSLEKKKVRKVPNLEFDYFDPRPLWDIENIDVDYRMCAEEMKGPFDFGSTLPLRQSRKEFESTFPPAMEDLDDPIIPSQSHDDSFQSFGATRDLLAEARRRNPKLDNFLNVFNAEMDMIEETELPIKIIGKNSSENMN